MYHLGETVVDMISELPPEMKSKIFPYLSPDLQTLLLTGHILVPSSRTVSLPSDMKVRVFLVGGGGHGGGRGGGCSVS